MSNKTKKVVKTKEDMEKAVESQDEVILEL